MSKVIRLNEAVSMINTGDLLAIGGNVLHRTPMAFVRELARQGTKNLQLIKTAGAHDIDLLCATEQVKEVHAGFVSYESKFGLANNYRRGVESGKIKSNEHACYTVISALRGAVMNVPFMPVHGLKTGDLLTENDYFIVVEDPFSGEPITLVKTMTPDIGVIHVQECDENGNARIYGPKFEDKLISRGVKKLIITTERIVPEIKMKFQSDQIDIPGFLVSAVVHTPKGASPCSCYKEYNIDEKVLSSFISMKEKADFQQYLDSYKNNDYIGERMRF